MTYSNPSPRLDLTAALGFMVMFGILAFVLIAGLSNRTFIEVTPAPPETPIPTPSPTPVPLVGYFSENVGQGRAAFAGTCAGCHGQGGVGLPGVGPNLLDSDFMESLDDDELREFIIVGRSATHPDNATGITMPERGGNPSLSDSAIDQIIAYLRTEADPSQLIAMEQTEPQATNTPRPPVEIVANPTVVPYVELSTLQPRHFDAARAYALSCSGCHGPNGQGIEGITAPLRDSELVTESHKDNLFDFIASGNPYVDYVEDIPHPARGDYPSMTDDQITELIDYLLGMEG